MKTRYATLRGLLFSVLFTSFSTSNAFAQAKAAKAGNIQGVVQNLIVEKTTITVRVGTVNRDVTYNTSTKFLYGHSKSNKAGAVSAIKQSYYISCSGDFNDKAQLLAKECIFRETK